MPAPKAGSKGGSKGDSAPKARYRAPANYAKDRYGSKDPNWTMQMSQKLPKKVPDEVLAAAKNMFFQLDRDNSGSIDADELGLMLRTLGQNPTDEELARSKL